MVWVAASGALANFLLAFVFSLLFRFFLLFIPLLRYRRRSSSYFNR